MRSSSLRTDIGWPAFRSASRSAWKPPRSSLLPRQAARINLPGCAERDSAAPTRGSTGKSPFGVRPLDTGIAVRRQVRALLQVSSDTIWRPFGGRAPSAPRGWWRGPGIDPRHGPDGERDLGGCGVRTRAAGYPGPVMADGCCGRGGCSGSRHDPRDGGQLARCCKRRDVHAERDGTAILASDGIVSPLRQREVGHPAAPALRSRDRLVAQPEGNGRVELRAQRSPADDAPRSRRRVPHPSAHRFLAASCRRQYEQLTAGTSERTGTSLAQAFGDAVQLDLGGEAGIR